MRLLEHSESDAAISLLPPQLIDRHVSGRIAERVQHRFRSDLFYSDIINLALLKRLPLLLSRFEEESCFIINPKLWIQGSNGRASPSVIEILREDPPELILTELSNSGPQHLQYLSVFYLSGQFSIVSPSEEWLFFAEMDEDAVFSSSCATKYDLFNRIWWSIDDQQALSG